MLPDRERVEFDAEIERLTEKIDEWTDVQAEADYGSDAAQQAAVEAGDLERLRNGVGLAKQAWDRDGVVFQPLTDGLRRAVRDLVDATPYDRDQCVVALGTVEAPYVEHDPGNIGDPATDGDVQATVANVPDLAPEYVDWASDRIADIGALGDEMGKSSRMLVLEKRQAQTSDATSGSTTAGQ